MIQPYRAAIIGTGRMAGSIDDEVRDFPRIIFPYSHAGTYQACPRTTLVAAADVIADKVHGFCQRWQVPRAYTDYRALIEQERPDILSITTRPASHQEIVVFAAEHGVRAIWCEKPLCCSMAEADAIVGACERHGVAFNLGVNRRYSPLYRQVRDLVASGIVGDLQAIICHAAGSALWSHSHASDLLLMLAGDPEIAFVQGTVGADEADVADGRVEVDPQIHSAFVQFATGVRGYILATIGYDWEITGTTGKLRLYNDGHTVELWQQVGHWKQLELAPPPALPQASSALALLDDLVGALATERPTLGHVALARRSQEMILGMIASHGRGGARVSLPLADRGLYVGKPDW